MKKNRNNQKKKAGYSGQEIFREVYQGRQAWLHRRSYMRIAKVLFSLRLLRRIGFFLRQKQIFDYGFGAGTLFFYLPKTAELYGVEQDETVCREVEGRLKGEGYENVTLRAISDTNWRTHPLLLRSYDLIVCSHVLEHLPHPEELLGVLGTCLKPGGRILGLVPIHERTPNPHHLQTVDGLVVERWVEEAGLRLLLYEENDPWPYWIQPLYASDRGWRHRLAQSFSLILGIPASLLGPSAWSLLGHWFGAVTGSRPTQAGFILAAR